MSVSCGGVVVRFGLWMVAICFAGYIVGPPLYWHLIELLNHSSSCAPCLCDCSSQPLISIPQGTNHHISSFTLFLFLSFLYSWFHQVMYLDLIQICFCYVFAFCYLFIIVTIVIYHEIWYKSVLHIWMLASMIHQSCVT